MKAWIWVPVALLAGLLIGAWPSRSELRKAKQEIEELSKTVKTPSGGSAQFDSVSRFLRIPDGQRGEGLEFPVADARTEIGDDAVVVEAGPALSATNDTPEERVVVSFNTGGERGEQPQRREDDRDFRARIEEATELWQMRSDMARGTFIANAGLNEEQAAQFDVLIASMNMRLEERIAHWADALAQTEEAMGPETGMRMINDLTSAMVVTYDEMDRTMPDGWRQQSDGSVDLTDFINPSVATPLIDVQDKLQDRPRRRNRF